MASKSSALGALTYNTESSFCENSTTFSTARLRPIDGIIDTAGLVQSMQKIDILKQRPSEGVQDVRMPITGASFSATFALTGLGSTAATTLPAATELMTFLSHVFGATGASISAGTTSSSGTASAPVTAASGTGTAGGLLHVGVKGDTRADGQWAAIDTHSGTTLNLLTALPAAPASADVVYGARVVYPSETAGTFETVQSLRFLIQTSQQQYRCHGCYPTAAEFMIGVGEVAKIKVTFAVSYFTTSNVTFPSATSVQDYGAAVVAGGSLFRQTLGTATRNTETVRAFSFGLALNNTPELGPNGVFANQVIVGCNRGPTVGTIEMTVDSESAGTDTHGALWDADENSRVFQHILYSMNVSDGRAMALYFPKCKWIAEKPVQMNDSGVNRKKLKFEALTGPTTTTDLTLSPWRLGFA